MKSPRIFLIWHRRVLRDMIERVLAKAGARLAGGSQGETALDALWTGRPDVVLVEDDALSDVLLGRLPGAANVPLLQVSLRDNRLHIYRRDKQVMRAAGDLLATLRAAACNGRSARPVRKRTRRETLPVG